ncbi:TPA: EscJ/YscJ/HrcJ family type III secretion inner membrane ring protein [Salmonella enterica]|nr:EscJ/YscJ/HrcJ family type III secretion inner membrane ring protein [Salmonella enterica subsp. diarizonae]HEA0263523.1 EscJ/YscJ/HrcJ family type III secretion inner membrane ring protein [Salmonella enterica]HEA0268618.1 EscJ/YscJ/HrcJ family type III secretion inner membrane ring protein [Salmonella enterica]HEA0295555.1 EscJ/YscJ/HrcJ family type III secretion inner membrane ring protein [Salmonella enterica]HEA0304664.1 EscJ/YscJ/HrcJ family type III secretion inner membrane ring prote
MIRIAFMVCILLLTACKQQALLEDLDQQQANEVVALLLFHNIAATKVSSGKAKYSIKVEAGDFPAAVEWLKVYNLPSRPVVEISEMFPADALISSPRAEKARLYSAIEQRLEQSLRTMEGIVTARVHVSYDIDASDGRKENRSIHLSALAVYDREIEPEQLINDIKRFLVNSFSDVDYANISVVLSRRTDVLQHSPTRSEEEMDFTGARVSVLILLVFFLTMAVAVFILIQRNKKKVT